MLHDEVEAFLEAAPDGVVVVDVLGRIVFINALAQRMFGYASTELVDQPVGVLVSKRFTGRLADHVAGHFSAPQSGSKRTTVELHARRKNGAEFPAELVLSRVESGQSRFVQSSFRDVTERKATERQLIEARDLAEQARKAQTALLATASHDLRQPVQTLMVLSGVLWSLVARDSEAAAAVDSQVKTLRRMGGLLNSLLNISSLEAGIIEPHITRCSMNSLLSGLQAEFTPLAATKGLELIVEPSDEYARTDPALLGQLLQNLLANAIRYTRAGHVRLRSRASDKTIHIEVADTGVGIPAIELERIFDEFYQAAEASSHDAREGLGLGLSIVRRTATLLGYHLDVTSTVGRGSCFDVAIPRAGPVEAMAEPATPVELSRH